MTKLIALAVAAALAAPATANAADQRLFVATADHVAATGQLYQCRSVIACSHAATRGLNDTNRAATRVVALLPHRRPGCAAAAAKLYAAGMRETSAAQTWAASPTIGNLTRLYIASKATDRAMPKTWVC